MAGMRMCTLSNPSELGVSKTRQDNVGSSLSYIRFRRLENAIQGSIQVKASMAHGYKMRRDGTNRYRYADTFVSLEYV